MRWLLATGVLIAAQVLMAPTASAHDALTASSPADGAQLPTFPPAITLTFNGPVSTEFSQVTVTGPDGAAWQAGAPQVSDDTVTQPLTPQGPAGSYEVAWRVVSSDGHPISGVFSYVVTTGPPITAEPSTASAPPSESTSPAATATPPSETVFSASPAAASTAGGTNWLPIAAVLVVLTVGLGAAAVVIRRRGGGGGRG